MPGSRRAGMARRARGRVIAGPVLPRRVLAAGSNCRHRLPQQGRDLRHPVQSFGRDPDHHRGRSQAPRRPHRHPLRPPHLGLGAHPSSACPYDCAGRRHLARRRALDRLPARLLPPRTRALAPVPKAGPGEACCRSLHRAAAVLRQAHFTYECASLRGVLGASAQQRMGGLQQTPIRGTRGSIALSRALHPSRRHLQPPPGRAHALALSLIERSLLDERPAWFVTAGRRGSGKTTTLQMIIEAIIGCRAAASPWSPNEEERRKALLSYFMYGMAYILWDNITRGAQISCPHIEKSCTTGLYADRKLGVSEMIMTAASTIHCFTGNNIRPRGDLASRSLQVRLDVDRIDPENRNFKH